MNNTDKILEKENPHKKISGEIYNATFDPQCSVCLNNNYKLTEKRFEKHTKEVIIEQIDICLSAQDPEYQLGRYVEKLREEIINQALAEDRERVREEVTKYWVNKHQDDLRLQEVLVLPSLQTININKPSNFVYIQEKM